MQEFVNQLSTQLMTGEETLPGDDESFDEFMMRTHFEENPHLLDDDLSDAYDTWVSELAKEDVVYYANEYTSRNAQVFADDYCKENGIE